MTAVAAERAPARPPTTVRVASVLRQIQRCGGVRCPPGTCNHDDDATIHRHVDHASGTPSPPSAVTTVLGSAGRPLDAATRGLMEERLGHDFSSVRIHTDAEAAHSASAIDARAYTYGRHVVMGSGRYRPDTPDGAELLAHELTHVVQQGNPAGDLGPARTVSHPHDASEQEAHRVARSVHGSAPEVRPPVGLVQRQGDEDSPFGGGSSGGGGASGSWEPADEADNVTMVELTCRSPTDGTIDFHLRSGSVAGYRMTVCELAPGDYVADVEVIGNDLELHLDAEGDLVFRFRYDVGPGQQDPSTFFGGQRRVRVRAGQTTPSPIAPRLPLVCSRPLDVPWWTGLRNFRHAYVNDPPDNYAIRGLVSGNGVTASCATTTDRSDSMDDPATSRCKFCLPAPGQSKADLSRCLRATHDAYPSPNVYRNLPDPKDGFRHGPNSNSYAAAMARCCWAFDPSGLGIMPGWKHAPAPPCPEEPTAVPEPAEGPAPGASAEPPRDAGTPIAGVTPTTGEEAAPTDLHAFGNRTKPRDPRLNIDIDPNPDGSVGPEPKVPPWPNGASTAGDPEKTRLTGPYHRIVAGTPMASGLRVIADGSDVGGPRGETHHTIFPSEQMPFSSFVDKFQGLGWTYAGKR